MNQKGFTLIELLTSLTLTSIVCILLFQVIFTLKDIYVNDSVKTELLIKNTNIAEKINSTFEDSPINTIRDCEIKNVNCLSFNLENGNNYELLLDRNKKIIKFGDLSAKLSDSTNIYDDLDVCYYYSLGDNNLIYNTFIKIRIPLEDIMLEEKFDINVIYQYNGGDYSNLIGTIENNVPITYIPQC